MASISNCATATGPEGTVTGTDEGHAHSEEWDVWARHGNQAVEVLTFLGNYQSTPGYVFHGVSAAGNGQMDLFAVEHPPGHPDVIALDIIDLSGQVIAHIALTANGTIGPAPGGGVIAWEHPDGSSTATQLRIVYQAGRWREISRASIPTSAIPQYPDNDGFGGGLP